METRCRQLGLAADLEPYGQQHLVPVGLNHSLGSLSDGAKVELLERFL